MASKPMALLPPATFTSSFEQPVRIAADTIKLSKIIFLIIGILEFIDIYRLKIIFFITFVACGQSAVARPYSPSIAII
jgi:hypothetical protein